MRSRSRAVVPAALAACLVFASHAPAADHKEAPEVVADAAADLNDVFAFVDPADATRTVLAMTVAPFSAPGAASGFASDVLYQLKVDNDADGREDVVLQFTFGAPGAGQTFQMLGPARPGRVGLLNSPLKTKGRKAAPVVTGTVGATVTQGDAQVFCGVTDDPFFFDAVFVTRLLGLAPGGPVGRDPGVDFFAGFNVLTIAVSVPSASLRNSAGDPNVRVWGTTSRPQTNKRFPKPLKDPKTSPNFVQLDRTGFPALSTALIPALDAEGRSLKDRFNRSAPEFDARDWRQTIIDSLTAVNGDAAYSAGLADALLVPDVLRLDTSSTAPFPNGRRPQDDVIDVVLGAASNGAVTSDGVDENDVPFSETFPYFGAPHSPRETIPPRDLPDNG
jgi:hypothetical protein